MIFPWLFASRLGFAGKAGPESYQFLLACRQVNDRRPATWDFQLRYSGSLRYRNTSRCLRIGFKVGNVIRTARNALFAPSLMLRRNGLAMCPQQLVRLERRVRSINQKCAKLSRYEVNLKYGNQRRTMARAISYQGKRGSNDLCSLLTATI